MVAVKFQFHKGTIKTLLCMLLYSFVSLYFNSIKVQLKRHFRRKSAWALQFQFHKGTIKTVDANYRIALSSSTFQFHKGTIKTASLLIYPTTSTRFQFHKGTIKTEQQEREAHAKRDFNSIKVQLKRLILHPLTYRKRISIP